MKQIPMSMQIFHKKDEPGKPCFFRRVYMKPLLPYNDWRNKTVSDLT